MEKLTIKELYELIILIESRQYKIRKDSYTNEKLAEEYNNLNFILVKLKTQLKML